MSPLPSAVLLLSAPPPPFPRLVLFFYPLDFTFVCTCVAMGAGLLSGATGGGGLVGGYRGVLLTWLGVLLPLSLLQAPRRSASSVRASC